MMAGEGLPTYTALRDSSDSSGPPERLPYYIISPDDKCYRLWEGILAVLVVYTVWASFFEFGFLNKPLEPFSTLDNISNAFFLINIVLNFFVAYRDRTTNLLVYDRGQIARRNISVWLLFDLISVIPSEFVMKIPLGYLHFYGIFSIFRLWRLGKVNTLFARLEETRCLNYISVRLAKLILVTLLAVHGAGCIFYFLAIHNPNPADTWLGDIDMNFAERSLRVDYVASIYWSITTLSTVGYGDLHPRNEMEMIFTICFMVLLNFGLALYVTDHMTKLVVQESGRIKRLRDNTRMASAFAQRNNLPVSLQNKIILSLQSKFGSEFEEVQEQEDVIASLPGAIGSEISFFRFNSVIRDTYLFREVSKCLIFQLASEMKSEYFGSDAYILLKNALPKDFYILVSGVAEIVHTTETEVEEVVKICHRGELFGAIGVLYQRPQLFSVRTRSSCHFIRLDRSKFLTILEANHADTTKLLQNLHFQTLQHPLMLRFSEETDGLISGGRLDLPFSPLFAVIRKSGPLLRKSLKQGRDPNEVDEHGITALHICAWNGNERHVRLLLDYQANLNIEDSKGSVPLWEAMLGGHEQVSRLLYKNGARLPEKCHGLYACTAAGRDNLELLKRIVTYGGTLTGFGHGTFIEGSSPRSTTALHIAAFKGNKEMIAYLISQGCDVDLEDDKKLTAKQMAKEQGIPLQR